MTEEPPLRYPVPEVYGNAYLFNADCYQALVERVSEHGRTIYGELTITQGADAERAVLFGPANFGLNGPQPGGSIIRELNDLSEKFGLTPTEWRPIISYVCRQTVAKYREGGPIVYVGMLDSPGVQWLEKPVLLQNQINWLYGIGGSGKSFYTRYIACKLRLEGHAMPLILDWETDADTEDERVKALASGLGGDGLELAYRQMSQPLTGQIDSIAAQVAREHISLVIVDSVGRALGGDSIKEELIIQMLNAISSLHVTSWLIDHTNDKGELYGNSYKYHQGRNIWEVKAEREPGEDSFTASFFNRKNNNRSMQPPFGIHFRASSNEETEKLEQVNITPTNISPAGGAYDKDFSMAAQIEAALLSNKSQLDPDRLREEVLGEKPKEKQAISYRVALKRLRDRGKIVTLPNSNVALASKYGP